MADTVLITDQDAQQYPDVVSRAYVAQDGSVVSGDKVTQMITQRLSNTSALQKQKTSEKAEGDTGILGKINSMGMLFAEYMIISKLMKAGTSITKNAMAFAAAGILQAVHILPSSFQPLLKAVSGAVGTDSLAGAALNGLTDVVYPEETEELAGTVAAIYEEAAISEGDDFMERDASDKTAASAEARVKAIYLREFGEDILTTGAGATSMEDLERYMSANGKLMAEDNVFLSCANKIDTDREFAGMRTVIATACAMLESDLSSHPCASPASRPESAGIYLKMAEGLAAYEAGAREGFRDSYANAPGKAARAETGLSMVMDASRGPVIASVKSMQSKYGLFTDDEMDRFRELLPGFDDGLEYDLEQAIAEAGADGAAYMPDDDVLNAYRDAPVPGETKDAKDAAPAAPRKGLDLSGIEANAKSGEYQVQL